MNEVSFYHINKVINKNMYDYFEIIDLNLVHVKFYFLVPQFNTCRLLILF